MTVSHAKASAKLYDGVGELWLKSYGDHVHIGALGC
jgi:hypothetical protein